MGSSSVPKSVAVHITVGVKLLWPCLGGCLLGVVCLCTRWLLHFCHVDLVFGVSLSRVNCCSLVGSFCPASILVALGDSLSRCPGRYLASVAGQWPDGFDSWRSYPSRPAHNPGRQLCIE